MKPQFIFLFFALTSVSSCIKSPTYPNEPHIEFKSVSASNSIIYMNGSTAIYTPDTITISFTDGDGDISVYDNPADSSLCVDPCAFKSGDTSCYALSSKNVFLIDSRDTCVATYNTGNVEPQGKFQGVSGEIQIFHKIFLKRCFVPSTSCAPETVKFKIKIRDRAGNQSNEVETPPITVEVRNL